MRDQRWARYRVPVGRHHGSRAPFWEWKTIATLKTRRKDLKNFQFYTFSPNIRESVHNIIHITHNTVFLDILVSLDTLGSFRQIQEIFSYFRPSRQK